MTPQEELQALRRMAELEAKQGGGMAVKEQIIPSAASTRQAREEQLQQDKLLYSPTVGMGTLERFGAAYGKAVPDVVKGIGANLGIVPRSEITEMRTRDAPLMETTAGKVGNIAGNLALLAPTGTVPINTVPRAMAMGAMYGAAMPAESGGEAAWNIGLGAALSGAGQGAAQAFTRPLTSRLTPEQLRLANAAAQEGIGLNATQQTGSRALRAAEAAFENIPSTAGRQAAQREAQSRQFTAAALRRAGITGDSATADVLKTQKGALGSEFESIAGRNAINVNSGLGFNLLSIADQAEKRLVPDQAATVRRMAEEIVKTGQAAPLPGTLYQGYRSELGRMAKGNDAQAHFFGQMKKELDSAFRSQIPQVDAQAWDAASRKYANLKTIIDAMGGPGTLPAGGQLSPAQLSSALQRAVTKEGKALGRGDLNELARIGETFIKPQTPDSGTAQRMLAQAILTGGGGYALTGDPTTALATGAAGLAIPAAAQRAIQSQAAQRAMLQGMVRNPALANAIRTLPQAALLPQMINE